jgi:hypothetical protein
MLYHIRKIAIYIGVLGGGYAAFLTLAYSAGWLGDVPLRGIW